MFHKINEFRALDAVNAQFATAESVVIPRKQPLPDDWTGEEKAWFRKALAMGLAK